MQYDTTTMNKDDKGIEVSQCEVIEVEFPTFMLEYNHTFKTYTAVPFNTEKYDYTIVLEGKINELENNKTVTYLFDRDTEVFEYTLTLKDFEEIKKEISNLFTI